MEVDLVGIATTDPSPRVILSALAVSKLRSASPRLHGVKHNTPSPTAGLLLASLSSMAGLPLDARKKVGFAEKKLRL